MTSHRREDAPETSTPGYALLEVGKGLAGIGLIGWVVIVYVASEIFDWSGGQIFGFAVAFTFLAFVGLLIFRIARLVIVGKWN